MKINKLISIFFSVVLLTACSGSLEPVPGLKDASEFGYEHDGKVTFVLKPEIGRSNIATKALGENPQLENLHVAVFDGSGSALIQYVQADPYTPATANDTDYQYTVDLKTSDKPCILHFIANGPEELRFGSEVEVIGELYTTGGESAYWQRIELPNITAKPETGDDDYDEKLASYMAVVDSLDGVKLLRNYSKITVEETCDNFVLDGFWFVNYPDGGSVAPYNRNTGRFMDDYIDYPTMESLEGPGDSTYTFNSGEPDEFSLAGGNYQGFMNATTSFIAHETFDNASIHALNADNQCVGYVYEREKALFSPMYLIVKGAFTESGKSPVTTFYKIALQDAEGDFYAMLRNFDYLVQIQSVASAGYSSAADALAGAPSGDISVNVDYQDLTNISDGDSRMTVSETTLMIIGTPGNSTTAEFWYKFEPDITGTRYSGAYNGTTEDPTNHTPYVTISYEGTSGSTGDVISSISIGTDDGKGNRHVTINTTAVGDMLKTQSIIITGKRWNGSRYQALTRTISLVLRNNLDLMVSAAPNTDADGKGYVVAGTGKKVSINLGIEGGLPSSLFPLEFKIDPVNNSLTPDNDYSSVQDLPVRSGLDANGYPTYWFEKTLTWAEYSGVDMVDGIKTFPVYFSTIVVNSATVVNVSQKYFTPKSTEIKNFVPKTFSSLAFSGTTHEIGEAETFSFSMSEVPSDGIVTVAMKGVEPDASAGLTYIGKDDDGYWIYKLSGVTTTSASFGIVPYLSGTAEIKLSARLFTDASKTMFVMGGSLPAGTVLFNDTFGTNNNVAIGSYTGAGITSDYNKTGISYSLSGNYTNISTTSETNMKSGHIRYSSSSRNDSATITISGISPYGAKKVTLSFSAYISLTSTVSGTSSVNGSTARAITSGANSYDVTLADDAATIEIKFVITHYNGTYSGTLGIDNVKLTVVE